MQVGGKGCRAAKGGASERACGWGRNRGSTGESAQARACWCAALRVACSRLGGAAPPNPAGARLPGVRAKCARRTSVPRRSACSWGRARCARARTLRRRGKTEAGATMGSPARAGQVGEGADAPRWRRASLAAAAAAAGMPAGAGVRTRTHKPRAHFHTRRNEPPRRAARAAAARTRTGAQGGAGTGERGGRAARSV